MLTATSRANGLAHRGRELREWLVQRPSRSIWASGLVGLLLAAGLTIIQAYPPAPQIHDEFSYLLSGDTFAHGRLTNPTHPMWRHFESFHITQVPTRSSKYPPAQGVALALGQVLTGEPIVGVWISCALMVAAFNWMLQAWVGVRWALWGALATAFWIVGIQSIGGYWATSYWGGAVGAMGGALVLGGIRRLGSAPTVSASVATGIGLMVLANSRPFEGALFALAPAIVMAWILVRQVRRQQWRLASQTFAPMILVVVAAAVLMGLHNRAVTGSLTRAPYVEYERQYASSPTLWGQAMPQRPEYRVAVMERFYVNGTGAAMTPPRTVGEFLAMVRRSAPHILGFFAPFFMAPFLVALPWVARGRWMRLALACVVASGIALAFNLFRWQVHYVASAAAAWCILMIQSARLISRVRSRRMMVGRWTVRFIGASIVLSAVALAGISFMLRDSRPSEWHRQRQTMEQALAKSGKHLVFVTYGTLHRPDFEWVYNRADTDASPVVWARSVGEAEDAALRKYYAGRSQWRIYIDDDNGPFELVPLSSPVPQQGSAGTLLQSHRDPKAR